MSNYKQISNTIWNVADLLRGSWKAHEYQDVILPLTVLKRLDAALEPTKEKVITRFNELDSKVSDLSILRRLERPRRNSRSICRGNRFRTVWRIRARNRGSLMSPTCPTAASTRESWRPSKHQAAESLSWFDPRRVFMGLLLHIS